MTFQEYIQVCIDDYSYGEQDGAKEVCTLDKNCIILSSLYGYYYLVLDLTTIYDLGVPFKHIFVAVAEDYKLRHELNASIDLYNNLKDGKRHINSLECDNIIFVFENDIVMRVDFSEFGGIDINDNICLTNCVSLL